MAVQTKIEEVARAMWNRQRGSLANQDCVAARTEWRSFSIPEKFWAEFEADARAAIEAMREPSRAMTDAGVAYALNVTISGEGGWSRYVEAKHRAMIDAALSEEPR